MMGSDTAAPERSDVELVLAFRAGEAAAFEELHRRYVGAIYRLVHRKLGDGLLAEDIAQETFVKALRNLHRVDESFNVGGWLHTVARNLCYDELRRRRRDPRELAGEASEDQLLQLPAPAHAFDPVVASEANELRRELWAVAQRLPEKYRLVLTLRELQGLSYRRIAQVMGLTESAVETLLYRARLRFKEEFLSIRGGGTELGCEEVAPLLAAYLAGKLQAAREEAVRRHLATCAACARKVGHRRPVRL